MNKNKTVLQSLCAAVSGTLHALKSERNLRIHLVVTTYLIYFSVRYYSLSAVETALLALTISFVISCELLNTAIEDTVDLETPDFSPLAKTAKDVAAGAVLVSSLGSMVVGVSLFGKKVILSTIFYDIIHYAYIWIPLILISLVVIFLPAILQNRKDKHE